MKTISYFANVYETTLTIPVSAFGLKDEEGQDVNRYNSAQFTTKGLVIAVPTFADGGAFANTKTAKRIVPYRTENVPPSFTKDVVYLDEHGDEMDPVTKTFTYQPLELNMVPPKFIHTELIPTGKRVEISQLDIPLHWHPTADGRGFYYDNKPGHPNTPKNVMMINSSAPTSATFQGSVDINATTIDVKAMASGNLIGTGTKRMFFILDTPSAEHLMVIMRGSEMIQRPDDLESLKSVSIHTAKVERKTGVAYWYFWIPMNRVGIVPEVPELLFLQ